LSPGCQIRPMRPERPMRPPFRTQWTSWTIWMLPRMLPRAVSPLRPRGVGGPSPCSSHGRVGGWSARQLARRPARSRRTDRGRARPRCERGSGGLSRSTPVTATHHRRVLRDTRGRGRRERRPYAGGVPARGSACGTAATRAPDVKVTAAARFRRSRNRAWRVRERAGRESRCAGSEFVDRRRAAEPRARDGAALVRLAVLAGDAGVEFARGPGAWVDSARRRVMVAV
jgi:hypothetical protein